MRINPPDIAERFDGSHHPKYAELREFQYSYSSVSSVVHHFFLTNLYNKVTYCDLAGTKYTMGNDPCALIWSLLCDIRLNNADSVPTSNFVKIMPHFDALKLYSRRKHCEKRRNCLKQFFILNSL